MSDVKRGLCGLGDGAATQRAHVAPSVFPKKLSGCEGRALPGDLLPPLLIFWSLSLGCSFVTGLLTGPLARPRTAAVTSENPKPEPRDGGFAQGSICPRLPGPTSSRLLCLRGGLSWGPRTAPLGAATPLGAPHPSAKACGRCTPSYTGLSTPSPGAGAGGGPFFRGLCGTVRCSLSPSSGGSPESTEGSICWGSGGTMAPGQGLGSGVTPWLPSDNGSPPGAPMSSGSKAKLGTVRWSVRQGAWPRRSPLAAASSPALSRGSRGSLCGAASQDGVLRRRVVLLPSATGGRAVPSSSAGGSTEMQGGLIFFFLRAPRASSASGARAFTTPASGRPSPQPCSTEGRLCSSAWPGWSRKPWASTL